VGLIQRGPGELDLTHADMMPIRRPARNSRNR
jgi:hypothetical protein